MTKSSLNRILRQFGDKADVNTFRKDGKKLTVPNPMQGNRALKPLHFGFRRLPHAEKMIAKKAFRAQLDARYAADAGIQERLKMFVAYWTGLRHIHGVGRPPVKAQQMARAA